MNKLISDIINNYILRETIENEDYPLYHRCGLNKLYQILKENKLDSRCWDGEHCIACTRSKSFVVTNTSTKYVNITFNIHKLKAHNRDIYIKNFSWRRKSTENYEYEERICNRKDKGERFTILDIDKCIDRIDLLVDLTNYSEMEGKWGIIFELLKHSSLYNKTFFTTNKEEWIKGITRNSHRISQFDIIEKGIDKKQKEIDYQKLDKRNNIDYLNDLYDDEDLEAQIKGLSIFDLHKYFQYVEYIKEYNCIKVVKDGKYNLLSNPQYKILIPCWVDELDDFNPNGSCRILKDGKYNLVNYQGQILSPQWFYHIGSAPKYGFYRVINNNMCNFISCDGKLLTDEWFDYCCSFREGFGVVGLNDEYNYIKKDGTLLSPNQWFDYCSSFCEGFGAVELNGKYNYIKKDGTLLSPNQWFDECELFKGGYGEVELNGKYYYINQDGAILSSIQ